MAARFGDRMFDDVALDDLIEDAEFPCALGVCRRTFEHELEAGARADQPWKALRPSGPRQQAEPNLG